MTACREYQDARRLNEQGYARVPFGPARADGRGASQVMLHRWIVEQVEGPLLPWPQEIVMHSCDNPSCFLYEHLSRATHVENNRDAVAKGRHVALHGEAHGLTKLTSDDVRSMRTQRSNGVLLRVIAERFGVCPSTVANIVARRTWSHVA